jgi:hypothetical protein
MATISFDLDCEEQFGGHQAVPHNLGSNILFFPT